jgi:hypothetical protein
MKHTSFLVALTWVSVCVSCAPGDPIATQLVFNELAATGSDFVELRNVTAAPLDVSGYGVTDSRSDGFPRISRAIRLPAGTVVPPNGYLVVLFEGECPVTSMTYVCVRGVTNGSLSQTHSENVHLIDPENQAISTSTYPMNAAPSGWTWGRFPDGTGSFKITRRTPGTANLE